MSKRQLVKKPLVPPAESNEAFVSRLKYLGKFQKASTWLRALIIHRIEDVAAVAARYAKRDFAFAEYEKPISTLFNQADNRFCDRFDYYCRMIEYYEPGTVPAEILADDLRLAKILIDDLDALISDKALTRNALRSVMAFHRHVAAKSGSCGDDSFANRLATLQHEICVAFAAIGDDFCRIEHAPKNAPPAQAATKEDVREIVRGEVAPVKTKIVNAVEDEAGKTRRCVKKTAIKAVHDIRTNSQSDYDKRGPTSSSRAFQFRAVVERMMSYREDGTKLPEVLRDEPPDKWIHQACRDVWTKKGDGYPSMTALYVYCHRNSEKVLSLSGY